MIDREKVDIREFNCCRLDSEYFSMHLISINSKPIMKVCDKLAPWSIN